jgi:hypothetical protein
MPTIATRTVSIEHVRIPSAKSFTDVRALLEKSVPELDPTVLQLLANGNVDRVNSIKEHGPELSIFLVRDHGALLQIAGRPQQALQYDIGNPITASLMTRHRLAKEIHAASADAKTYSESLKAAFPDLQQVGFVDLSASYLYAAPR